MGNPLFEISHGKFVESFNLQNLYQNQFLDAKCFPVYGNIKHGRVWTVYLAQSNYACLYPHFQHFAFLSVKK